MLRRILILIFCCSLCGFAQSKRPFTFEDMMQLKRIGEPIVSPDSKWVAFSAVDVNLDENTRKPHLWIVSVSGGEARRLTPATGSGEDRIRFSPDGKRVIFESSRDGGSQIWVQDFDTASGTLTGEPRKVTSISTEASGGLWSPDGKSILFVSEVYPDCKDDACNKQRDDEQAKSKVKAKIFTQLMFRHWNHYFDGKYSHLFLVSADGGVARDLTPGAHEVPPFSLGGQDQYQFSPDGQEVAYTSNIDEVQATSTNSDIFIVPVAGGTPKKITTNPGSDSTPMYSPDGKYIAYRSQLRGGYESDRFRLMLYERATGKITDLTPNFDRWVDSMAWAPDSKTIYFTAENEGEAPIYTINVTDPKPWPQELVAGFNDSPTPTPDGKTLLFDRMSIAAPNEIYSAPLLFPQCRMAVPPNAYSIPDCLLSKAQAVTNLNAVSAVAGRDAAVGEFLVHGRGERESPGLHRQAAKLRREQEVSGEVSHPRRARRRVGRRLVVSLESRAVRRQRLRSHHGQLPRFDGLRTEVHRRHQWRLGWRSLPRPDVGP